MEYVENANAEAKLLNSLKSKPREGLHLSDLVFCVRKAYYRKNGMAVEPSTETQLLWITGYAFQNYLYKQPEGHVVMDGIECSPDVAEGVEVKSTRQSSKKFRLNEQRTWLRQIMGYAYAMGKTDYGLTVLFVCGNYAPPFPQLRCYDLHFTKDELVDNWSDMLNRKLELEGAMLSKTPPSCAYRENWECDRCEFINNCQDVPEAVEAKLKKIARGK